MLNNLSLRQLQSFLGVAQTRSFRRTAELVGLSQPAVTAQIRQVEDAVGLQLFNRTTRRVALTAAGERFKLRVEQALGDLEAAMVELRTEAALERGTLFAACVPTMASRILPQVMTQFARRYPGISLHVADVVAVEMLELIARSQVDIGIGPRPRGTAQFDFRLLTDDPFVAVVPQDHALARRKSITLQEFVKGPVLALPKGSNTRDALEAAVAAQGLELNPIHEVRHYYTLGGMVEAGLGITALPSMAVSVMSQPLLKTIPIRSPVVTREIGVITAHGNSLSVAAAAFVRIFGEVIERKETR